MTSTKVRPQVCALGRCSLREIWLSTRAQTQNFIHKSNKKKERQTHSRIFSEMLNYLKSANDRAKMLGYLCSCIHLHGNQSCICICKIPFCYNKLRSCYTCDFFHHIHQYLGDYYKNHSVTLQSKRRKYLHDIWTVELAA